MKGKHKKTGTNTYSAGVWELLPAILLFAVLPLISVGKKVAVTLGKYDWFPNGDYQYDFFLYWKSVALLVLAVWMLLVLADRALLRGIRPVGWKSFLPLVLYGGLAVLSALTAADRSLALHGLWQQHESLWVLLAYLTAAFYCSQIVTSLREVKILLVSLSVGALAQGLIGVSQLSGADFFSTGLGRTLLTLGMDPALKEDLVFRFAANAESPVYLASYTPNYAGVYLVMVLPVVAALLFLLKKRWAKMAAAGLLVLLAVCLYGTGSKTGILVCAVLFLAGAVLLSPGGKKKRLILGGCVVLVLCAVILADASGNHRITRALADSAVKKTDYALQRIAPQKGAVLLQYKGHTLLLSVGHTEAGDTLLARESGKTLSAYWDTEKQGFRIEGEDFEDILFDAYVEEENDYLVINCQDITWNFVKDRGNGEYLYLNRYGKADEITTAKTVLGGREQALTGRGYLWGRTIPLLGKSLLLGSGPDSFILEFPQTDYVMRANTGKWLMDEVITKPHSLYLQIAVQTGVFSLLCLLVFWGSCIRNLILSIKKDGRGELYALRTCLLLSIAGYLLMGLLNDSNPAVSPIFWALLGLGLAASRIR